MAKSSMGDALKKRMNAAKEASELAAGDGAYQRIFQAAPIGRASICDVPLDRLIPFRTADIGFKPYSREKLAALAEQLQTDGLMVRIIVRKAQDGLYEILAGHNRTNAARLAGWDSIPAEVVEADDARAIVIATSTNLIQRQNLSIIERGKAYKALLDAKNRNGQRTAATETFGDNRQRYSARALVAEFFGVTEYEIRKAIKLTRLIPELQATLEERPRHLNLACAELIADYGADSQSAFAEMCGIEGYLINKATVQHIVRRCPPPSAERQRIFEVWREARADEERKRVAPSKRISFDRRRFEPYLDRLGSDRELEELFLEFLRERVK